MRGCSSPVGLGLICLLRVAIAFDVCSFRTFCVERTEKARFEDHIQNEAILCFKRTESQLRIRIDVRRNEL